MPGGINDENLEQRIERIRKRDEEIEKKHREAEADRLAALQANAMVKTTAPADDDWPKAHKYDKLDFTYDVKCDQSDVDEKKPSDEPRLQRPFKKFPEGQGPPSDPKFNFLADAERDGKTQGANASNENKNWRANSNSNSSLNSNRRNNSNNSSFNRGRNGGGGGGGGSGSGKGGKPQTDGKKGKPSDEPILRKNDRERNNEQRMQRQRSSDGMWRRASDETKDNKKSNPTSPTGKDPKSSGNKPSVQQRMGPLNTESESVQQKLSDLSIEKRGNITVSVTKDGEVKSVKLEAARQIGSGRVGGVSMRNLNSQNVQQPPQPQQFVVHTQPSVVMDSNLAASTMSYPSDLNYPTIDQFIPPTHTHQQLQLQQQQQQHQPMTVPMSQMAYAPISMPTQAPAPAPMPTASTQKPMTNIVNGTPFKLPSVQDRLIKNRVYFDENLRNVSQTGNGVGNN